MITILKNISNLLLCSDKEKQAKRGKLQGDINLIEGGYVIFDEKIRFAGNKKDFDNYIKSVSLKKAKEIDCKGKTVMPGFIDSHTHLVFAGSRCNEYEMKIAGRTYEEIALAGGGIKVTVESVRSATKKELYNNGIKHLKNFIKYGSTTLEAKSGYGLTVKDEIKLLEVINEINIKNPWGIDILPTFLGAHSIPPEYSKKEYIDIICYEMLPEIAKRKLAKFIDVFCEKGYFDVSETEKILNEGRKYGLIPKLHTDQFYSIGGLNAGVRTGAITADHLESIDSKGISILKRSNMIASLLPGCSYFLNMKYPPARKLIENNIPIILATDFNPGSCMTENIQIIASLASLKMKMTTAEIIIAMTINAAYGLYIQSKTGSLDENKQADINIFDFPSYKDFTYHFAVNQIERIFKKGKEITNI